MTATIQQVQPLDPMSRGKWIVRVEGYPTIIFRGTAATLYGWLRENGINGATIEVPRTERAS